MKILLQNLRTKLYFNLLGVRTDNPSLAYDFRHSSRAVDYARLNGLAQERVRYFAQHTRLVLADWTA